MLGKIQKKINIGAYPSASNEYHRVLVINEEGEFENLLITPKELKRIRSRVKKNEEDLTHESLLDKIFVWFSK